MIRQDSGSVVCPECGRLVDVNEQNCPHCGRWQPGMFGYAPLLNRFFGDVDVTKTITFTCVLLYALGLALDPAGALANSRQGLFGILSPGSKALYQLGMTGGLAERYGFWWTPLSATYLHGGILHIVFNLLWLRMLGSNLEHALGPARFFLLYSAAGAGGFVISNSFSGAPTVGASGAIFGLLAASIVVGRHEGGSWGQYTSQQALMWAVLLFVMGLMWQMTNNWAHAGGFIVGWLVARLLVRQLHRAEGPAIQVLAALTALGTVGAMTASFFLVTFG